jgi:hypothetical protein
MILGDLLHDCRMSRFLVPAAVLPLALAASGCGLVNANATSGGPDDGGVTSGTDATVAPAPDGGMTILFDGNVSTTLPDGGFCSGSGPVIPVPGAGTTCTGDLGARTFLFAVCACKDVAVSGILTTTALGAGGADAGKSGGSIGANGAFDTNSTLSVNGDVWASSTGEATAVHVQQSGTIAGDVHAGAAVQSDQTLTIGGNLSANGNVTGTVLCAGTATLPSGDTAPGLTADGGLVNGAVAFPAPCDCTNVLDVPTIVSGFASNNDDTAAGFTPTSLSPAPTTTVTVPCGRYYFDGVSGSTVSLGVTGRAAIFVNGDLHASSQLTIQAQPGAQVDLFISGNLLLEGGATIGSSSAPAAVRVYVGGTTFTLSGSADLGANVYAPNADVQLSSNFTMAGSLFVGSLAMSGAFTVKYDESILGTAGCAPTGGQCQSCHDCEGATPACKGGACVACVTDSDCCAPLHCSGGLCYDQIP